MFTAQNTWKEIEDAKVRTAVVTIGSTEQHGTHLPLTTDTLIAEKFAQAVAEELGAYLTPSIPIGQSEMWLDFPGSLSLSAATMRSTSLLLVVDKLGEETTVTLVTADVATGTVKFAVA